MTVKVEIVNPVGMALIPTAQVRVPFGATSGALDANDAMGDIFVFDQDVYGHPLPKVGRIISIKMIDQYDVVLAPIIHIFNRIVAVAASDAEFAISAVDAAYWVTSQTFGTFTDLGS